MAEAFNKECVESHNYYRKHHGCPPIVHSAELQKTSQEWADHLAQKGAFQHSDTKGLKGENIAMSSGKPMSGKEVSDLWYSEVKDYDYAKGNIGQCGHFSQVLWKGTTEAGFAFATGQKGSVIVGQYRPAGNMLGKIQENVPAPADGKRAPPLAPKPAPPASGGGQPKSTGGSGGDQKGDFLMSSSTKTATKDGKTIKTVVETYKRPDGSTYTVTKDTEVKK